MKLDEAHNFVGNAEVCVYSDNHCLSIHRIVKVRVGKFNDGESRIEIIID